MSAAEAAVPVSEAQLAKAIAAILKHLATEHRKHNELFGEAEYLYLVIALAKLPYGRKDKPKRITLPHPIFAQDSQDVCLFVKDLKGEGHKQAKARLAQQQGAGIKKVVGLSKLKGKYEAFEAKRQLCDSFDLFLADERILPSLPSLIGKSFFKKKKQPIPVRTTVKDWGGMVRLALSGTHFYPSPGNCISIKFARSDQTPEQCLENAVATLKGAAALIPGSWRNIKAVHAKSAESLALPVLQVAPEAAQDPAAVAEPVSEQAAAAQAAAAAEEQSEQPAQPSKLARKLAKRQASKAARGKRRPTELAVA